MKSDQAPNDAEIKTKEVRYQPTKCKNKNREGLFQQDHYMLQWEKWINPTKMQGEAVK